MLKTVALYEFLRIVRSKTYLISLFIVPLLAFLPIVMLLISSQGLKYEKGEIEAERIAILDYADILPYKQKQHTYQVPCWGRFRKEGGAIEERDIIVKRLDSFEEGKKLIEDKKFSDFFVIPSDYKKDPDKSVAIYTVKKDATGLNLSSYTKFDDFFIALNASTLNISDKEFRDLIRRPKFDVYDINPTDTTKVSNATLSLQVVIPVVLVLLFSMTISTSYDGIILAVTREKRSKLIEILLGSISADTLLFGKVIGVLGATLLKMFLWGGMFLIVPYIITFISTDSINYQLGISTILFSILFAAGGILLYGALCAGAAFLIDSEQGVKFPMLILLTISGLPVLAIPQIVRDPSSFLAQVVSQVPFFSPIGMPTRLAMQNEVPIYEILLSLLLLGMTIYLSVKLSARLFRVVLARQGEKTGIVELARAVCQYK
ncbi:MAG: ABC transporter permease [Bdellovibrionota bacterium]|jgi:ABC-2 type transport system permease protein